MVRSIFSRSCVGSGKTSGRDAGLILVATTLIALLRSGLSCSTIGRLQGGLAEGGAGAVPTL